MAEIIFKWFAITKIYILLIDNYLIVLLDLLLSIIS